MMKRLITLILALVLALTPMLTLAEDAEAEMSKLLSLWSEYLAVIDMQIRGDLLWTEAVLTFAETKSWKDMLRAQAVTAAVTDSRNTSGQMTLSSSLTDAERTALIAAGVDVDHFVIEMEGLNSDLSLDLFNTLDISTSLLLDCFATESLSWTAERAELHKMTAQDEARWLCTLTNYLLSMMNDEGNAASYWAMMDYVYPNIAAFKSDFVSDEAAISAAMDEIIASMEMRQIQSTAHLGEQANTVNAMLYAIENGDPYYSREDMVIYEDRPYVAPSAPWWGVGRKYDYFAACVFDDEGNLSRMTVDSDLTRVPDVMAVQSSDVQKADVMDYIDYLMEIGFESVTSSGMTEDSEALSVTLMMKEMLLIIRWNGGTASVWNIGPNVMFVPDWYISLLLQE